MFQHICGMPRHTFSTFYMDIGLVLTLKFCLVGTCFHPEMIAESPLCDSIFSFIYIYLSFVQSYVQMRYDTSHDRTRRSHSMTVIHSNNKNMRTGKYFHTDSVFCSLAGSGSTAYLLKSRCGYDR